MHKNADTYTRASVKGGQLLFISSQTKKLINGHTSLRIKNHLK